MLIETEWTPNPATLKFLPGGEVLAGGADFPDADAAGRSPLAQALFMVDGVERVYFGADFVSVTKGPLAPEWHVLKIEVLGVLVDHFSSGRPLLLDQEDEEEVETFDDPADADKVAIIRDLITTKVRPAVAMDGGDILYRGYQNGVVFVHMRGSCAGCPSHNITLKMGVERLLKNFVPEVNEVRAI